jgi:PKD repeat protein
MYKSFFVTIVAICLTLISFAQSNVFQGEEIPFKDKDVLAKGFKTYQVFQIDAQALSDYVKQQPEQAEVSLSLGNSFNWDFKLHPRDIRSENYSLVASTAEGKKYYPKSKNKTFRGYLLNQDGGSVYLTLDTEFIFGYFEISQETFFIEPLWRLKPDVPHDWFLVYKVSDVIEDQNLHCAFDEMEHKKQILTKEPEKETPNEKVAGECYKVEIAIASDWLMFDNFGSVANVENFTLGNLNNVQGNYDDEFADEIQFEIVTQFVSSCSSCDPWTSSTSSDLLLPAFRNWGNQGGFGVSYDVASLWSDRNFQGSTIGLAWVGVLCETNRYNILQHFTTNSNQLRVLQAHELGHNFNSLHDSQGSNTIMAPSVNSSNNWSSNSQNVINSYINAVANNSSCFSGCTVPAPPEADIVAPVTHVCPGSVVPFIDNSTNSPDSWNWQFSGGNPTGSSEQHPTVVYENEGFYPVTLNASNAQGSNFTSLSQNIQVDQEGTKYLLYETFENPPSQWQILNPDGDFTWSWTSVGGADYGKHAMRVNNYEYNNPGQIDGLVSPPVSFVSETDLTLEVDYAYRRYDSNHIDRMKILVSTDGGNSFPFTIFDEQENGNGNFATEPDDQDVFNPSSSNDWCGGTDFGADCISLNLNQFSGEAFVMIKIENVNDYGNNLFIDNVRITSNCTVLQPATPSFSANETEGCAPFTTTFFDQSIGAVESREWQFEGGTPGFSTEVNPSVFYSTPGNYTVSLTVYNAAGQATSTQNQYVTILPNPIPDFTSQVEDFQVFFINFSQGGDEYLWDCGDGETSTAHSPSHTYIEEGEYTVSLTVTGDCGTETIEETLLLVSPLVADFSIANTIGCAPFSVSFTDNSAGNISNWEWTFEGATPATSTEENPTVEYDSAGTYSVTLTVSNDFVENTVEQFDIIVVDDSPTAGFTSDNPPGVENVQFTDNSTGANSYAWDFGNGQTDTIQNPANLYEEEGEYSVTLIVSNDCGTDTTTQEISIIFPPESQFTSASTEGCNPSEIQFTGEPVGEEYTYEWTFEGGNPESSNDANPLINYEQGGQFNVQLIVSNIAGADTLLMEGLISINEGPTADFTTNNPIGTEVASFSDNSSGASNYSWDFGDGQTDTIPNPTNIYDTEGEYTVTLVVSNDCGFDTLSQEVAIILPPDAAFTSPSQQGCTPMEVQFTGQPAGDEYTYEWTFEGGTPGVSNDSNPLIHYEQSGQFNVQLIVSNMAGADTLTLSEYITINEEPSADFFANNSIGSGEISFIDNSSGATSYTWNFGNGQTDTASSPTYVYEEEGDYIVSLIVSNDCGSDTLSQDVSIIFLPDAQFTSSSITGCNPTEIQFTGQPEGQEYTYLWIFEGGNPESSNDANPVVSYNEVGNFDVQLIVSNAAGSDTSNIEALISINGGPTADFTINSTLGTGTVSISDNSTGVNSYSWDFGDGHSDTSSNPSNVYENEGNYIVTLVVSNDCGSDTLSQDVNIVFPPEAQFTSSIQEGCNPAEIQFTGQPLGDGYDYQWTFEGGEPMSSFDTNPAVMYNESGQFDVQLIVSNSAGSDTMLMTDLITIDEVPVTDFNQQVNGFVAQFFNNTSNATSFFWQFGDGETSDVENPNHTYQGDGTYIITLTALNDCGESNLSDTIEINSIFPLVSFSIENNEGCAPIEVEFVNTSENTDSIAWIFPGGSPEASGEQSPVITYNTPGIYEVSLIAYNEYGSSALTQMEAIIIGALPFAEYEYEVGGPTVNFTNISTNYNSLEWNFGDGITSTEENPSHVFELNGIFEVQLVVENDCGTDTLVQEVNIIIDGTNNIQAFSGIKVFPNPNSGHFTLEITSDLEVDGQILIFDIIGQKLFEDKTSLIPGTQRRNYNFSHWANGVYLLKIESGRRSLYKKLIIDK